MFRRKFPIVTYVSVDPEFHPARWWTSRQTILHMCWEYWGIAVFYLGPYITAWIWDTPLKYVFRNMG